MWSRITRPAAPLVAALLFGSALACGGGTGPAEDKNNPGTGTATLRVIADIISDDESGIHPVAFNVQVRNAQGLPISGATVTVQNFTLGTITLTETGTGTGNYAAVRPVFPSREFRLDVISGENDVRNVVIGNVGLHSITAPSANSTVTAGEPLTVSWGRPAQAQWAELETRDFESPVLDDAGTYTIPGANNPARDDQRIRVFRFNEVTIAGGTSGSRLRLRVRNTVEPVVVQ